MVDFLRDDAVQSPFVYDQIDTPALDLIQRQDVSLIVQRERERESQRK